MVNRASFIEPTLVGASLPSDALVAIGQPGFSSGRKSTDSQVAFDNQVIGGVLRDVLYDSDGFDLIKGRGGDDFIFVRHDPATWGSFNKIIGGQGDDTIDLGETLTQNFVKFRPGDGVDVVKHFWPHLSISADPPYNDYLDLTAFSNIKGYKDFYAHHVTYVTGGFDVDCGSGDVIRVRTSDGGTPSQAELYGLIQL